MLGVDPLTRDRRRPRRQAAAADPARAHRRRRPERVGEDVLRRWLRADGPGGRPLDHLLASDYGAFEDDLATLAERGLVLRGGRRGAAGTARGRRRVGDAGGRGQPRGVDGERLAPRPRRRRTARAERRRVVTPPRVRRIAPRRGRDAPRHPPARPRRHAARVRLDPRAARPRTRPSGGATGPQASSARRRAGACFFAVDETPGAAGRARVGRDLGGATADDGAPLRDVGRARGARESGARRGARRRGRRVGGRARCPSRVRTEVTVGNDGAARLYERAGFRDTGERGPLGHSDARTALLERPLRG